MDDIIFTATGNVLGSEFKFIALYIYVYIYIYIYYIYKIYVCVCVCDILNLSINEGEVIVPALMHDVPIIKATAEMPFETKTGMNLPVSV